MPPGATEAGALTAERPGGVAVTPFFAPAYPMTVTVSAGPTLGTHLLAFAWTDAARKLYKLGVAVDPAAGLAGVSPGTAAAVPVAGDLRIVFPNRVQATPNGGEMRPDESQNSRQFFRAETRAKNHKAELRSPCWSLACRGLEFAI